MKKVLLSLAAFAMTIAIQAQSTFQLNVDPDFDSEVVVIPPSPLKFQILFEGNKDMVQTNINEEVLAKQWHDFIGFTPLTAEDCVEDPNAIGWVSVSHEMIASNDKIGDGGGMTSFLVGRNPADDLLYVIPQTLSDGRSGDYFNVDFSNVGETGMNCGGINSIVDGRIWTAEEWFRGSNDDLGDGTSGVRDLSDYTIKYTSFDFANFQTIEKYQNFNWMVEIDPRAAKAVRKQYNWGRQPFEGGTIAADNKTVYLGVDSTPGFFSKFVADIEGDFTKGKIYVYKHDADPKWIEIDNNDFAKMLDYSAEALKVSPTMYNRIEWVTINEKTGKIYMTETGRDNPGSRWSDAAAAGAVFAPHHIARATDQGVTDPTDDAYWDYYGRILEYDPTTEEITVHLEAGPFFADSPDEANYPDKHLSNPDGLNMLQVTVDGTEKTYMLINEDLNGTSNGRVPAGFTNRACEMYILDMDIENPTLDDLVRLTQAPVGAEITGACATKDGKTVMVNSQHPADTNPAPYNNSLTFAITGFDDPAAYVALSAPEFDLQDQGFQMYPNPVERIVYFNKVSDIALYDIKGQRVSVQRNTKSFDISGLATGTYILKAIKDGVEETKKLVIK